MQLNSSLQIPPSYEMRIAGVLLEDDSPRKEFGDESHVPVKPQFWYFQFKYYVFVLSGINTETDS